MKAVNAEILDGGEKRDTRGRKIADAARRTEVVAAYATSGLTQKAFARREGVNYHTLVAWLGREQRPGPRLPTATPGPIRFRPVQLGPTTHRAELEVALPGGLVVRGGDAAQVAALVKALTA